jgi:hypothetical protein
MKTQMIWAVIFSAFLIGLSFQTFAQEMGRQDYLDKSQNQKTTGFVLAGVGLVLLIVGGAMATSSSVEAIGSIPGCVLGTCPPVDESGIENGSVIMVIGGLAAVGSIPLFISAGKNARKAAQVSFRNEPTYFPKYVGNIPRAIPSLHFSIPLN